VSTVTEVASKAERKRQQIGSLVGVGLPLAPVGGVVVDFGSGTGHLGLTIAAMRPDLRLVVLVEQNPVSAAYARERAHAMGLLRSNDGNENRDTPTPTTVEVRVCCCDMRRLDLLAQAIHGDSNGSSTGGRSIKDHTRPGGNKESNMKSTSRPLFDLGVTLHSCGPTTDWAQSICMHVRAAYVIAPCCYGWLQNQVEDARDEEKGEPVEVEQQGRADIPGDIASVAVHDPAEVPPRAVSTVCSYPRSASCSYPRSASFRDGIGRVAATATAATGVTGARAAIGGEVRVSPADYRFLSACADNTKAATTATTTPAPSPAPTPAPTLAPTPAPPLQGNGGESPLDASGPVVGRIAMELIDIDRSLAAAERGYAVRLLTMHPLSCSPKNHLLCGKPLC
jgi:hypothetical protein